MNPDPSPEALVMATLGDDFPDTRPVIDTAECHPDLRGTRHDHRWCTDWLRGVADPPRAHSPAPDRPTPGDLLIVVGAVLALALVLFGAAAMAVPR